MSRLMLEGVVALASFVGAMMAGYRSWRAWNGLKGRLPAGVSQRSGHLGDNPVFAGVLLGLAVTAAAAGALLPGDRFHSVGGALTIIGAIATGLVLILHGQSAMMMPSLLSVLAGKDPVSDAAKDRLNLLARRVRRLQPLLEMTAAVLVVAAGVRFGVVSVGERSFELGAWSPVLTLIWIMVAMNVVKLLGGLDGAANVLLLVASVAIFYFAIGGGEHFLSALALAVAGAALGSLRFNCYPARMPLSLRGHAVAGFLFAVMTVLARQKTVAVLLLVFPLALVVIVLGGAMLAVLERTMMPGSDGDGK